MSVRSDAGETATFTAIELFTGLSQAADARAGMVAAALGTIGIGIIRYGEALQYTFQGPHPLPVLLFIGLLVLHVGAGTYVVRVLTPSLPATPHLDPASFLSIAEHEPTALLVFDHATLQRALCEQVRVLAYVTRRKYRLLRRAVLLAAADVVTFLSWSVATAILGS